MKKWISVFLLLTLLLSLSACHGAKENKAFQVPDTFDESKQYEITFWAKNDTNMDQVEIYKKAIADFQKLYPNITVNLRLYTDYGRIYNDVITNISTGTTPNVCITYPDHIATYMTGEKTFVEKLGYEIPEVLTWDFIWEVSDAAAKKGADGNYLLNGQKVMIPFIYKSTDNMMIQMLRQKGAGYSTAAGEVQIFHDTTKELLYTIADHVKTGAFSTFKISSYPANFLNAGQCVFAIDSTGGATWMGSNAPLLDISADKLVQFETVVRPIPQFDPENPTMISQGPSVCVFNKEDPQEVLASWLFAQYLLTNEVQIAYSQTEGYIPVTSKAQKSDVYQDYLSREGEDNDMYYDIKIQAAKLLLSNVDNTFVTPVFNGSTSLRDASGQMIENVVKSVRRKQTVNEEYIQKLYADVTSLYRLDQIVTDGSGKQSFGQLPAESVALLCGLVIVWILIGVYALWDWSKRKNLKNH